MAPAARRRPGRLVLAVAAAMAVPQARTAILEFLRIQGATVERVQAPPAVSRVDLGLAEPMTSTGARRLDFEPLVPDLPGSALRTRLRRPLRVRR